MDNDGNALNKMKQFWIYFSYNFRDGEKIVKRIKKIKSVYRIIKAEIKAIFSER